MIYYYFSNQGRYNIHIESDEEHGIIWTQAPLESKFNAIVVVNTVIITIFSPCSGRLNTMSKYGLQAPIFHPIVIVILKNTILEFGSDRRRR